MNGHHHPSIRMPADPTDLTVKMLLRELNNLSEVIEAKLDGMQKHQDEKFSSIQTQFRERDTRTEQTSKDSKVAVDAALQAAKEAVGEQNKSSALAIAKSENATTKQIEQIGSNMNNITGSLNDKIDDVKARLLTLDGKTVGSKDIKEDNRSSAADTRAGIAIAVSVAMALITVGAMVYASGKGSSQAGGPVIYVPAPAAPATRTVP